MKVFVSYSHEQSDWVRDDLVPVLEAGGAEVLVDWKEFAAGRTVVGQMEPGPRTRPNAICSACPLTISPAPCACRRCAGRSQSTPASMAAAWCRSVSTPPPSRRRSPHRTPSGWISVTAIRPSPGACCWRLVIPTLVARPRLGWRREMASAASWRATSRSTLWCQRQVFDGTISLPISADKITPPDLAVVDLHDGRTEYRDGWLSRILAELGASVNRLPKRPNDLRDFTDRMLALRRKVRVCVQHFDEVQNRRPSYDISPFKALRWLVIHRVATSHTVHSIARSSKRPAARRPAGLRPRLPAHYRRAAMTPIPLGRAAALAGPSSICALVVGFTLLQPSKVRLCRPKDEA